MRMWCVDVCDVWVDVFVDGATLPQDVTCAPLLSRGEALCCG